MRVTKREGAALKGAEHPTSNIQHPTLKGAVGVREHYDLEERLLEYAARIIRLVDALRNSRAANHVGAQLLRAGTSSLPNHGEAQAAESLNDFVHKLKICLKELRESFRWLRLIARVPLVDKPDKVNALIQETDELIRIFVTSIRTAKTRNASSAIREHDPSMLDVGCWMLDVQPSAGPVNYKKSANKRETKPRRKPRQ